MIKYLCRKSIKTLPAILNEKYFNTTSIKSIIKVVLACN